MRFGGAPDERGDMNVGGVRAGRPSDAQVAHALRAARAAPLSYDFVGVTLAQSPSLAVEVHSSRLGLGESAFVAAR